MRKTLAVLGITFSAISFYMIVVKMNEGVLAWSLSSVSPFLLLTSLAIAVKNRFLQAVVTPSLLFFGLGTLVFYAGEFSLRHFFPLLTAALMLLSAGYIIVGHVARLKFIRLAVRLTAGALLLVVFLFLREKLVPAEIIKGVAEAETSLFFNR